MLSCLRKAKYLATEVRQLSTTASLLKEEHSCRLLVVGGGSGGCSVAAKFASKLGKGNVIVIEPADVHYYQPLFTLVGGGHKKLEAAGRKMADVLPKNAVWLRDEVVKFDPHASCVYTKNGTAVSYEFMVVALGMKLNYDAIPGLLEGLKLQNGVCSNYCAQYVNLTLKALQQFREGNAVFTFPKPPVKCPGAPQKIAYLTDEFLRKTGKRDRAKVIYNTALPVIFGVKKYADALWKVVEKKGIEVNLQRHLIEVKPHDRIAVFEDLDNPGKKCETTYEMLHVAPPQGPVDVLKESKELTDASGFIDVDRLTLQHVRYPNIFGIGDCTNLPTSKTAAAVAAASGVVRHNLEIAMGLKKGQKQAQYDGYSSCPLVTGFNKCILAEFDYNLEPLETFPVNQGEERALMYTMKADVMPELYWHAMLKGHWEGPKVWRKVFHLGFGR